jgi:hypothetical protein
LAQLVERELMGGEEPSISLVELDPYHEGPLGSSEIMAPYLSTMLKERSSHLRIEPVESYYFDVSPYTGLTGKMSFLALVDPQANTRKLFTLGPYKQAITWWPEQNSGPVFERARLHYYGSERQRELRRLVPDVMLAFLAPMAEKVRLYVESYKLTVEQAYDLEQVTKWDKVELKDLVYIALALGTTLEAILAEEA